MLARPRAHLRPCLLVFGPPVWPVWCNTQVIFDSWRTIDNFGIADAEFAPYWKPNGITSFQPQTVVSVYRKPGAALLVVLNTAMSETRAKVKVDPRRLGLPAGYQARMAANDAPVQVTDETFEVLVPARGYVLVVLGRHITRDAQP
jgi:hypothetical protein